MIAWYNYIHRHDPGNELVNGIQTTIIILSLFRIQVIWSLENYGSTAKQNIIIKSQLTTKSNGTILTEYSYGSQTAFGLPDKMIFSVDVKNSRIPKSVVADMNNTDKKEQDKERTKPARSLSLLAITR